MKRGREVRSKRGERLESSINNEIMALMFVMVERTPGAFSLRFVSNDDLLEDLQRQGALQSFLEDVERLYSEFRQRFKTAGGPERPN